MSDFTNITSTTEETVLSTTATVVLPPHKTIKIQPVKDAFISYRDSVFNFGTGEELMVKHSSTDECKSLLAFTVPAISEDVLASLNYAKLKLTVLRIFRRTATFELRANVPDTWSETGVTWMNRPTDGEVLATATIQSGADTLEFDLFNIIKANTIDKKYSFTIVETTPGDQTSSFFAGSRESTSPPVIEYDYAYYPDNANYADLDGSLYVMSSGAKDLPGSLVVVGGLCSVDIDGTLNVKQYSAAADLNGSLYWKNRVVNDLEGMMKLNAIAGSIDLNGSAVVVQHGSKDIEGTMVIKTFSGHTDINGSLNFLKIAGNADINGSLAIKAYGEADLAGSIISRAAGSSDLAGTLSIKQYSSSADVAGSMSVRAIGSSDLSGSISVNQYTGNTDIAGSLFVRGRADIDGSLTVKQSGHIDLNGSIISRPRYGKDIDGTLTVKYGSAYGFIM